MGYSNTLLFFDNYTDAVSDECEKLMLRNGQDNWLAPIYSLLTSALR